MGKKGNANIPSSRNGYCNRGLDILKDTSFSRQVEINLKLLSREERSGYQ